jgi:hypothetical protein
MNLKATRATLWAASIEDRPAGLADKIEPLANAGARLEFILARRAPETPGKGVVFLAPLAGLKQCRTAVNNGFYRANGLHSVRIEGTDKPGLAAKIARALAEAGINLRGFSATRVGRKFIGYLALDDIDDVSASMRVLKKLK